MFCKIWGNIDKMIWHTSNSGDVNRGTLADDAIDKNLHQNIGVYPTTPTANSNTSIYYNCMVTAYTDQSALQQKLMIVNTVKPFDPDPSPGQPGS